MNEASKYADSPQARQMDEALERPKPALRLVDKAGLDEFQTRLKASRQVEAANSRATIKRGLAELEAFFAPKDKP